MKFFPAMLVVLGATLFAAGAGAQLKMPGKTPAAPAAPAAAPAAAPTPENAEKEAAGKLAAQGWLILLDRRDWGRAWETSSAMFRSAVPLGTWMDGIPKVREPLGALVERTSAEAIYKTTLEGRPNGEYVTVNFQSKFDKRELQEVVTMVREPDGKWRATGYSIR